MRNINKYKNFINLFNFYRVRVHFTENEVTENCLIEKIKQNYIILKASKNHKYLITESLFTEKLVENSCFGITGSFSWFVRMFIRIRSIVVSLHDKVYFEWL